MISLRFLAPSVALALATIPARAAASPPPAIALDTATLDTGVTLEYAEKGHGKGKVVIFLHGYTDSWFSWSEVLARLPPQYHGYALSQRGHGDSERPASGYAMEGFADDVIAFMDEEGIAQATVVGHSMGSVIAQRVAIDHPDRVERLVLVGSAANAGNEGILGFLDYVLAEVTDPLDPGFVYEFQASTLATPVSAAFLDTVVAESLKVPAFVWHAALAALAASDTTAELPLIEAPTLIVWGDQDTIFFEADQQALDAGIPRSTLLVYEGIGHGVHWEDPDRFTDDLVGFMRSTKKKKS
jgi:pimeloyl-ACP methyl ester carboxylesterase